MIAIIVAISTNHCIGTQGALPWRLPEDMKHFRELTTGHTVVMGRKTWESIPEKFRPLPDRLNIVITRQESYSVPENVLRVRSLNEALANAPHDRTIFVIGGAEVYAQAFAHADELFVTHVNQHVDGDAFFPTIDERVWKKASEESRDGYSFAHYTRVI